MSLQIFCFFLYILLNGSTFLGSWVVFFQTRQRRELRIKNVLQSRFRCSRDKRLSSVGSPKGRNQPERRIFKTICGVMVTSFARGLILCVKRVVSNRLRTQFNKRWILPESCSCSCRRAFRHLIIVLTVWGHEDTSLASERRADPRRGGKQRQLEVNSSGQRGRSSRVETFRSSPSAARRQL